MKDTVTISRQQLLSLLEGVGTSLDYVNYPHTHKGTTRLRKTNEEAKRIIDRKYAAFELKKEDKIKTEDFIKYIKAYYPGILFSDDVLEIARDFDYPCAYVNNCLRCYDIKVTGLYDIVVHVAHNNNVYFFSTDHCQEDKGGKKYTPISYGGSHKDFINHDEKRSGNILIDNPDPNCQA